MWLERSLKYKVINIPILFLRLMYFNETTKIATPPPNFAALATVPNGKSTSVNIASKYNNIEGKVSLTFIQYT